MIHAYYIPLLYNIIYIPIRPYYSDPLCFHFFFGILLPFIMYLPVHILHLDQYRMVSPDEVD
jgi:hypothetical protein